MLEVIGLDAAYGERTVLRGLSFGVRAGEIVAVIGPNGAGKSTLIKAISGVLTPLRGEVRLAGRPAGEQNEAGRARLVAVVPQGGYLPSAFTVHQTVLLGRTPHLGWLGRPRPADLGAVHKALAETDLVPLQGRVVGELSGGEAQRVLLARALAQDAPVLLLDEPTAHLDLKHQSGILHLVRKMAVEKQLAVLIALHDLNHAAAFADRILLLVDGVKTVDGPPEEVLTVDNLSATYGVPVRVLQHPATGEPVVVLEPRQHEEPVRKFK